VPIYALGDQRPSIHPDAYVHPDAIIIGSVTIGANSSVWPGAVLRGDDGEIIVGQRTSVQDNSVIHTTLEHPTTIGDDCVIGHLVHLEACTIESWCLIGVGSIVLHRVVVNSWAIVAANAVLLNDTIVPSGALAVGTPAVIKEGRARREDIETGVASYVERAARFATELHRID
jgi:carbonic anhydrase/acetyltransferase-like protein (isoleucine patch superfamily)